MNEKIVPAARFTGPERIKLLKLLPASLRVLPEQQKLEALDHAADKVNSAHTLLKEGIPIAVGSDPKDMLPQKPIFDLLEQGLRAYNSVETAVRKGDKKDTKRKAFLVALRHTIFGVGDDVTDNNQLRLTPITREKVTKALRIDRDSNHRTWGTPGSKPSEIFIYTALTEPFGIAFTSADSPVNAKSDASVINLTEIPPALPEISARLVYTHAGKLDKIRAQI